MIENRYVGFMKYLSTLGAKHGTEVIQLLVKQEIVYLSKLSTYTNVSHRETAHHWEPAHLLLFYIQDYFPCLRGLNTRVVVEPTHGGLGASCGRSEDPGEVDGGADEGGEEALRPASRPQELLTVMVDGIEFSSSEVL